MYLSRQVIQIVSWLTKMSQIRLVNIYHKLKRMAHNENEDNANKYCRCCQVPEKKKTHCWRYFVSFCRGKMEILRFYFRKNLTANAYFKTLPSLTWSHRCKSLRSLSDGNVDLCIQNNQHYQGDYTANN